MRDLLSQFSANLTERGLIPADGRLLVAVSGGLDSMVLLSLLHRHAATGTLELTIAHANHQLRDAESEADEAFVSRTADALGLPCVVERLPVREALARTRDSLEMTARRLRHAFLARAASERGISTIALAHHADDQAELVLLRLLRGAGGDGLGGMPWRSPSPVQPQVQLVRPLLGFAKNELSAYAQAAGVKFREDSSNRSPEFLRNRIRHDLLPRLEQEFNPGIRHILGRIADVVGTEADFVSREARHWLDATERIPFAELHLAVQRAVLREQLWALGHDPSFDVIERLRSQNAGANLSQGRRVQRNPAGVVSDQPRRVPGAFKDDQRELRFRARGGGVSFGGVEIQYELRSRERPLPPARRPNTERFAASAVGRQVRLRHWRPGDRFQPLGFPRPSKLQDLFVNRKIPATRRRTLLVATTQKGTLFWVESLPPGERFKVRERTRRELVWQWERTG